MEDRVLPEKNKGGVSHEEAKRPGWDECTEDRPPDFSPNEEARKTGKYGRYLAHVILEDGSDLVQRLKENGFEKRKDYK